MKDNEEEEEDDNYHGFPEYGDTSMGDAEGEDEEEALNSVIHSIATGLGE